MNVKDRIMDLTEKNIQAQIEEKTKSVKESVEQDREKILKALDMIEKNLVYKDVKVDYGWGHKYVLATEEMFFLDYAEAPESCYDHGVIFTEFRNGSDDYIYKGVFTVNGKRYYDMRYLLQKYGDDVRNTQEKIRRISERLREIYIEYEASVKAWPDIKKLIKDWNDLQETEVI